jgi:hypothetical protein
MTLNLELKNNGKRVEKVLLRSAGEVKENYRLLGEYLEQVANMPGVDTVEELRDLVVPIYGSMIQRYPRFSTMFSFDTFLERCYSYLLHNPVSPLRKTLPVNTREYFDAKESFVRLIKDNIMDFGATVFNHVIKQIVVTYDAGTIVYRFPKERDDIMKKFVKEIENKLMALSFFYMDDRGREDRYATRYLYLLDPDMRIAEHELSHARWSYANILGDRRETASLEIEKKIEAIIYNFINFVLPNELLAHIKGASEEAKSFPHSTEHRDRLKNISQYIVNMIIAAVSRYYKNYFLVKGDSGKDKAQEVTKALIDKSGVLFNLYSAVNDLALQINQLGVKQSVDDKIDYDALYWLLLGCDELWKVCESLELKDHIGDDLRAILDYNEEVSTINMKVKRRVAGLVRLARNVRGLAEIIKMIRERISE